MAADTKLVQVWLDSALVDQWVRTLQVKGLTRRATLEQVIAQWIAETTADPVFQELLRLQEERVRLLAQAPGEAIEGEGGLGDGEEGECAP